MGFWSGAGIEGPAFYSYMAPIPEGFREAKVRPAGARFDTKLGEFLIMYDDIRAAQSPSWALLEFCRSTYEAGAIAAKWDRANIERSKSA